MKTKKNNKKYRDELSRLAAGEFYYKKMFTKIFLILTNI